MPQEKNPAVSLSADTMESSTKFSFESICERQYDKSTKKEPHCANEKICNHVELNDSAVHNENIHKNCLVDIPYKLYDIPGKYPIAIKVNQLIWPTSMSRVSLPAAIFTKPADNRTRPASMSYTEARFRSMQIAQSSAKSRISKGVTIMRSTGSTRLMDVPKSFAKSFTNLKHLVIDANIMNFKENVVERIFTENNGLREMIKSVNETTSMNQYIKNDATEADRRMQGYLIDTAENEDYLDKIFRRLKENRKGFLDITDAGEFETAILRYYREHFEEFSLRLASRINLDIEQKVAEFLRRLKTVTSIIRRKHEHMGKMDKMNKDLCAATLDEVFAAIEAELAKSPQMSANIQASGDIGEPKTEAFKPDIIDVSGAIDLSIADRTTMEHVNTNETDGLDEGHITNNEEGHNFIYQDHTNAPDTHLDELFEIGDDSLFGILGVYCCSG